MSVPASAGLLDNLIGINLSSMVARCAVGSFTISVK